MRIATVLLTAQFALSLLHPGEAAAEPCASMAAASNQKNGGKTDTNFSASRVIDIDLWILFAPGTVPRSPDNLLEVRLFTPGGFLYQSVAIPFSSDPVPNRAVKVDGYPHPIPVRALREITANGARSFGVPVRLPVAGTSIVTNSLYGRWTAQAFVNGDPVKCSEPLSFVIEE